VRILRPVNSPGDGAGLVDVTVVAFDLRFRAGDQLLRQQLDSGLQ